jgi:hypothetical protein
MAKNIYSTPELHLFIDEIQKRINVLENKVTDAVANLKKTAAWNGVTLGFNSGTVAQRTEKVMQLGLKVVCLANLHPANSKRFHRPVDVANMGLF